MSPPQGASLQSTVVNIVKTVVGAGILALPFAYRAQGLQLATLLLCLACGATLEGIRLQLFCAKFMPAGKASFAGLARVAYPSLCLWFDATIAAKAFGVAVSYLVIAANLGPELARDLGWPSLLEHRAVWVLVSALTVGPVCFKRSLDALKYTSIAALVAVAYVAILVAYHWIAGDLTAYRGPVRIWMPLGAGPVLQTLPIFVFAFTCAHNVFTALNELQNKWKPQAQNIMNGSLLVCVFLYLVVGIGGYWTFGDKVGDNIVMMYPQTLYASIARGAIMLLVLFSFPLQLHPCRESILSLYAIYRPEWITLANAELQQQQQHTDETAPLYAHPHSLPETEHSNLRYAVATALLLAVSFVLASQVNSLEIVLSFVGATGSTAISFIFPGFLAYKLSSCQLPHADGTLSDIRRSRVRRSGLILAVFGISTLILCVGSNFVRLMTQAVSA